MGGAACPVGLVREAIERELPVHLTYGSSEMCSQVTTSTVEQSRVSSQSVGEVLPHRDVMIDADGEILVRGETRFMSYITKEGEHKPFDPDGWFATGDVGYFDAEGQLFVQGRKDTMFISGGENIYPEEIEKVLMDRLSAETCVVVPVPDDQYGQRPVAFVKTKEVLPTREALDLELERFKWPDRLLP
ncbi:MAG: AMP-binding protein [Bacteroidales bacterium]|nr:AMP-binding protein [Bacteroidales bacterium]